MPSPTIWLAATAGAIGALATIPFLAAGLFEALPLSFLMLAICLIWLQRLGARAGPGDLGRVRTAWAATAWLLLAGGLASALPDVSTIVARVAFAVACAGIAALAIIVADRIVPRAA